MKITLTVNPTEIINFYHQSTANSSEPWATEYVVAAEYLAESARVLGIGSVKELGLGYIDLTFDPKSFLKNPQKITEFATLLLASCAKSA